MNDLRVKSILYVRKKIKRSLSAADFMFPSAHFLKKCELATLRHRIFLRKFHRETLKSSAHSFAFFIFLL